MDINFDKTTEYDKSDSGRTGDERMSPHRPRVTFHLGTGDRDDEFGTKVGIDNKEEEFETKNRYNEMKSPCENSETDERGFKKRVSQLVEDEETWEELKKESEKDEIPNDFGTVAKHLLKKSSIYAVSQVGYAESPYRKILWILVLTAGLLGCCYEIYRFLTLYLQYPVVINLLVENKRSLEFPAVTICNLNRMEKDYEDLLTGIQEDTTRIQDKPWNEPEVTVASCSNQLTGIQDPNLHDKMVFLTKYSQLDPDNRKTYGHQYHDLIRNCSFNGIRCPHAYFSYFQSLRYGNCFTFNKFSVEDDTVLKTSTFGIMSGLDMILDFDPDSYLSDTFSVGARVIIHNPREDPNPEEEGVNISPGFETTLAIKQTGVSRLRAPYKDNCVNYGKDEGVRGKSRSDCVKYCIQEQNYERCSCVDPTLNHFRRHKHCNMTDSYDACCLDAVLESMATEGLPCKCPLPCSSTSYDVRSSTANWPSGTNYFDSFCDWCPDDEEALKLIRIKQARLKIYYTTLESTTYEQKAMFQDSELFSHLGGQLGLWLGLSIVAAFELVENVIFICKYCTSSKKDK